MLSRCEPLISPNWHNCWHHSFATPITGLDAVLNVSMLLGIVWSSPLFMSVGTLLTIPTSIVADRELHGYKLSVGNYAGIACIIVGFLGLTFAREGVEESGSHGGGGGGSGAGEVEADAAAGGSAGNGGLLDKDLEDATNHSGSHAYQNGHSSVAVEQISSSRGR